MRTKIFKGRFAKVIVFMIIANFIFAGNVFASDSLRATAAKDARDGGTQKDIARDLKVATDGGDVDSLLSKYKESSRPDVLVSIISQLAGFKVDDARIEQFLQGRANDSHIPSMIREAAKQALLLRLQRQFAQRDGGNIIVSLPNKQEILEELRNPQAGTIFYAVISDSSSDTDTVIAAIAKAYWENVVGLQSKNIIAFPVIQGELNDETRFVLEEAEINAADLLFLAEDEVEDLLVGLEKKNAILHIALTDHSAIHAKKENLALLEGKLEQVIDHHPVNIKIEPGKIVYAKVGSTNTLIFERFRDAKIEIPKNLALLMLSAILSDTKNLKVNVTDRDTEAAKKLKEILNYSDADVKNLFIKQTYILNTIDEKKSFTEPFKKIISSDRLRYSKIGEVEKYSFAVCPLNYDEKSLFEKLWPKILEYIQTDMQKRNLDVALFNLTHLTEEADINSEELYIIGSEDKIVEYKPALRIFEQDKLEKVEELTTGISVYRLEHKKRFARKETVAKITDYFSYIQAEDTIYSVSGGRAIDNLVEKVLEKAREILKRLNLEISATKLSDYKIQVIWRFAGITIRKNFTFRESPNDVGTIVTQLNQIIIPILKENNLDLRKEADYNRAIELTEAAMSKELSKTTLNLVKETLLPTMRTELSNSKRIQRIEEEPRVFIVPPNVFKKGGLRNILRKVAELREVVNIKIVVYGDGSRSPELDALLGIGLENIITAKSQDELFKELVNRNIEPAKVIALITPEDKDTDDNARLKEAGIRQIVVSDIAIPAAAKAVNELYYEVWGDIGAGSAFAGFLDDMVKIEVISPIGKDMRREIAGQIGTSAIFTFPKEFEPNQKVIETIEEVRNKEAFKKIVEEFI